MIADTIRLYADGFGEEVVVTQRTGDAGPVRQPQALQVSEKEASNFDMEYPCPDLAATALASLTSCLAPPHHRGVRTDTGLTLNYSVLYKTPLVFEYVGAATR